MPTVEPVRVLSLLICEQILLLACRRLLIKHACVWWPNYMAVAKGNRSRKKIVAPARNWKEMPKMRIQTECQAKWNKNRSSELVAAKATAVVTCLAVKINPTAICFAQASCQLPVAEIPQICRSRKQIIFRDVQMVSLFYTSRAIPQRPKRKGGRSTDNWIGLVWFGCVWFALLGISLEWHWIGLDWTALDWTGRGLWIGLVLCFLMCGNDA